MEHAGEQLANVVHGDNIRGYEAGAFVKLMVAPIYVKPMALYNFSSGSANSNTGTSGNFTMHRIETPLLFGLRILKPISIEAGPVYNYVIASNYQFNENVTSVSQCSGLGYRAGIAIEIS